MNRSLPHSRATVTTAGRGEDETPDFWPCTEDRLNRERLAELNGTKPEPTPYEALVDHTAGPIHKAAVREAKRICAVCPVARKVECLVENRDHPSVVAGLTIEERDRLRASRGPAPTRCGVEGCDELHLAKGMCRKHYRESRRESGKGRAA